MQTIYKKRESKTGQIPEEFDGKVEESQIFDIMTEQSPTGHVGNLTEEQELKLKEFWGVVLKTFGVAELQKTPSPTPPGEDSNKDSKKPKKKAGLFSRSTDDSNGSTKTPESDDKYGQTKEYQDAIANSTPEELRLAFWSMTKHDHPDALLLRFLRARKWDINKALIMLISALHWRAKTIHIDDLIMKHGDGGAAVAAKGTDSSLKKESEDFLNLLRLGESFLYGKDKTGRPVCYIRVRLHKPGVYSEASLEKYTVYIIETCRLLLEKETETAALIFDMTDFSMANMDYAPVKFMIKCFEANYPESLGVVLVHKAPWLFSGIWAVIKGWLDPVVASKINFTKTPEDLEKYVSRTELIKEVGGANDYEYKYIEPVPEENTKQQDTETMKSLMAARFQFAADYQDASLSWMTADKEKAAELKKQRHELAGKLHENYWLLDPYVRARSLYDRQGVIPPSSKKATPTRSVSIKSLSEKHSGEVVTTRPITVGGSDDELD